MGTKQVFRQQDGAPVKLSRRGSAWVCSDGDLPGYIRKVLCTESQRPVHLSRLLAPRFPAQSDCFPKATAGCLFFLPSTYHVGMTVCVNMEGPPPSSCGFPLNHPPKFQWLIIPEEKARERERERVDNGSHGTPPLVSLWICWLKDSTKTTPKGDFAEVLGPPTRLERGIEHPIQEEGAGTEHFAFLEDGRVVFLRVFSFWGWLQGTLRKFCPWILGSPYFGT